MKTDVPILKRLGPVPFWRGEVKCLGALEAMYKKAMEAVRKFDILKP
jgi:hypothetical protein